MLASKSNYLRIKLVDASQEDINLIVIMGHTKQLEGLA